MLILVILTVLCLFAWLAFVVWPAVRRLVGRHPRNKSWRVYDDGCDEKWRCEACGSDWWKPSGNIKK